jgi:hypothetical protein
VDLTLDIKAILPDPDNRILYTLYLFNKEKRTLLPVNIDSKAAENISCSLQKTPVPRPEMYDVLIDFLAKSGAVLSRIKIHSCSGKVFHTFMHIQKNEGVKKVEMKLSDALCICIRLGIPLYTSENVLKKAGIEVDPDMLKKYI